MSTIDELDHSLGHRAGPFESTTVRCGGIV